MSINPSTAPGYMPPPPVHEPPSSSGGPSKTIAIIATVVAVVAGGLGVYLYQQVNHLRDDLTKVQNSLQSELDKIREANVLTSQSNRRSADAIRDQVESARRQANALVGQAKTEALKKVEETRAQLEAAQAKSEKELEQASSQISEVKKAADTANTKIESVNTEVGVVKSDVASTKSELEKTIADLKRTNGDLNGQGVLIATNAKELAALRQLGERNFVEFTIHKSKQAQKVGDIGVLLKKTDPKKNRYTIELTADDKTVEKRDRTINEPLQFLTSKAKQPYELVVNDVKKDTIVGYVSIPKVMNVRN